MYERQRTAWGFAGGGPGSGLYQSTNGGKSWTKVTGNGLPRGTLGRIALDICKSQPTVMYAQIEAAPDKETGADLDVPAGRAGQPGAEVRGAGAGAGRRGGGGGGAAAAVRRCGGSAATPIRRATASGDRPTRVRPNVPVEREPAADVLPARSAAIRTTRPPASAA
jgi:hypothetical protein